VELYDALGSGNIIRVKKSRWKMGGACGKYGGEVE
jgi:hypothetical protein